MLGPKVDKSWVQGRLRQLGKTQREFAAFLGMHPPGLTNLLNGQRKLSGSELQLAAQFLDTPLSQTMKVFGLDRVRNPYGRLPIRGYVDATSGGITLRADVEPGILEEIDAPFPGYEGCAVKIKGDSMTPRFRDGEAIGFTPHQDEISSLVGQEVVAQTEDGRLLLKVLHKGDGPDLYTLVSLSPAEPPIANVRLHWASPLDWHLPRRT